MERFSSLYAITYAIINSMENLRFDKEGYFQISTRYFIKEIENIFPGVPIRYRLYVIYSWNFGRAQNSVETLVLRARVPTSISRSPKLPLVFLNCMETRTMFSISKLTC